MAYLGKIHGPKGPIGQKWRIYLRILGFFFVCCYGKTPWQKQLNEEGFISAHSSRHSSSWQRSQGSRYLKQLVTFHLQPVNSDGCVLLISSLSPCIQSGVSAREWCCPLWVGLPLYPQLTQSRQSRRAHIGAHLPVDSRSKSSWRLTPVHNSTLYQLDSQASHFKS